MNNSHPSLILAFFASAVLLASCGLTGSEEDEETQTGSLYFEATLNGNEAWIGQPEAGVSRIADLNWLQISGDTLHEDRFPYTEALVLSVAYTGPDDYTLVEVMRDRGQSLISGSSYYEDDGDVSISTYYPTADSSANELTITSYDAATGIMEGTFRTTVVIAEDDREAEPGEPPRRQPDTLRFIEGRFRVEVEDRREE